jgi:glucose/arabinose dehydrogenase
VHLFCRGRFDADPGETKMKNFLFRLALAVSLTLAAIALSSAAGAQQTNPQQPASNTPPAQQSPSNTPDRQTPEPPSTSPQAEPSASPDSHQNEPAMPTSGTANQVQNMRSFSGRVVRENGKVVLKDPVTKDIYEIDDTSRVKSFMGKQVKITGRLEPHSNTIRVQSVAPMP